MIFKLSVLKHCLFLSGFWSQPVEVYVYICKSKSIINGALKLSGAEGETNREAMGTRFIWVHPFDARGHICRRRTFACEWAALLAVDCALGGELRRVIRRCSSHTVFYCGRRRVKWRLLIYTDSLAGSALLIKGAAPTGSRRRVFISPPCRQLRGRRPDHTKNQPAFCSAVIHNKFVQKVTRVQLRTRFIILICSGSCVKKNDVCNVNWGAN